jgi:preprotein translocase subunit SecA
LIISAPAEESTDKYYQFAKLASTLSEEKDYTLDEKLKAASLTDE